MKRVVLAVDALFKRAWLDHCIVKFSIDFLTLSWRQKGIYLAIKNNNDPLPLVFPKKRWLQLIVENKNEFLFFFCRKSNHLHYIDVAGRKMLISLTI